MPIPQQLQTMHFQVIAPPELETTVKGTLTTLFRNVDFTEGRILEVTSIENSDGIYTAVKLDGCDYVWELMDREINSPIYNQEDWRKRVKERVRLGVQTLICQEYGIPFSPWGILTGVRPTKLVHRLLDRGFSSTQIQYLLTTVYHLAPSRQQLLLDVAIRQRPFFLGNVNNPVSIYVGIPFCPTRCSYCSFAAYPLDTHQRFVPGFMQALFSEIQAIGQLLQELGVRVQTVYLGGGTPTTITGGYLRQMMELLNFYFQADQCAEYTVEAGRPETLTEETLLILRHYGVQRISINPQTMHDRTLKKLGRNHTAEDVRAAFARARDVGFAHINSDLILGLPGENVDDFADTLREIIQLAPDNITVHSLALKRASQFGQAVDQLNLQQDIAQAMADLAQQNLKAVGMLPYYLYRQRFIVSDLENIGYAMPGAESIYNIQMMEERQTIIGLGGGAITKLISPDLTVVRQANPKCPATYTQKIQQLIAAKKCQIRQYLDV